jgi:hypothetical protein
MPLHPENHQMTFQMALFSYQAKKLSLFGLSIAGVKLELREISRHVCVKSSN